jgi:hypothetical protein
MKRDDQSDAIEEFDTENQLSELMQAHLDDVEGGGAHNSWKRTLQALEASEN